MKNKKYIVHGITANGDKKTVEVDSLEEAGKVIGEWLSWWWYFLVCWKAYGTEADFWIE